MALHWTGTFSRSEAARYGVIYFLSPPFSSFFQGNCTDSSLKKNSAHVDGRVLLISKFKYLNFLIIRVQKYIHQV